MRPVRLRRWSDLAAVLAEILHAEPWRTLVRPGGAQYKRRRVGSSLPKLGSPGAIPVARGHVRRFRRATDAPELPARA